MSCGDTNEDLCESPHHVLLGQASLCISGQLGDPGILSDECSLILLFFWEEDQTLGISKIMEMRGKGGKIENFYNMHVSEIS